jgi:hypothetical protein
MAGAAGRDAPSSPDGTAAEFSANAAVRQQYLEL